jgi:hypothetical protein
MKDFLHNLDAHLDDILKVNLIGLAAFAASWTDIDHMLRTLGLVAALVYTVVKIVQAVRDLKK